MTVRELKDQLSHYDGEDLVVLAKDAEGNGFSPLAAADEGAYRALSTWHGKAGLRTLTPPLEREGYDELDVITGGVDCVVLWPVN